MNEWYYWQSWVSEMIKVTQRSNSTLEHSVPWQRESTPRSPLSQRKIHVLHFSFSPGKESVSAGYENTIPQCSHICIRRSELFHTRSSKRKRRYLLTLWNPSSSSKVLSTSSRKDSSHPSILQTLFSHLYQSPWTNSWTMGDERVRTCFDLSVFLKKIRNSKFKSLEETPKRSILPNMFQKKSKWKQTSTDTQCKKIF